MFSINITQFIQTECMRDYSASIAEIGPDAARDTWQACTENAPEWRFLKPEDMDDFRAWVQASGGWTAEEIAAWSDDQLQALCLQWIAGDARECGIDSPTVDWGALRADQENGRVPSSIYRADDGAIYWECQ